MIPFAPGFFKPYIAATTELTQRFYDAFTGSDGSSISGRTPNVGGTWSAGAIGAWNAEILSNTAVIDHDLSGSITNTGGHYATLTGSWSLTATMKVKLSLDFVVKNIISSGTIQDGLATAASGTTAFPSDNGFQLYVRNYSSGTQVSIGYEARKAGTLKQNYGTLITPTLDAAQNITVEYDAATSQVVFSHNSSVLDTDTLVYTELPASISHAVLRVSTYKYLTNPEKKFISIDSCLIAFDS